MDMNRLEQWAVRHGISQAAWSELQVLFCDPPTADDSGSEAGVQSQLRLAAPTIGCALYRNNSGATLDETGRMIRYGLANDSKRLNEVFKSSDLIGPSPILIRPHHIGRTLGIFTAVEVKEPSWTKPKNERERAQSNFLMTVERFGGIGMFCTSVDQYLNRIKQCA